MGGKLGGLREAGGSVIYLSLIQGCCWMTRNGPWREARGCLLKNWPPKGELHPRTSQDCPCFPWLPVVGYSHKATGPDRPHAPPVGASGTSPLGGIVITWAYSSRSSSALTITRDRPVAGA